MSTKDIHTAFLFLFYCVAEIDKKPYAKATLGTQ